MTVRYVLAPEAALDLVQIWRHIKERSSVAVADHVESAIREKIAFVAQFPGVGHRRNDLTDLDVKFFPVYSYLVGYRPTLSHFKSHPSSTVAATWNESSKKRV